MCISTTFSVSTVDFSSSTGTFYGSASFSGPTAILSGSAPILRFYGNFSGLAATFSGPPVSFSGSTPIFSGSALNTSVIGQRRLFLVWRRLFCTNADFYRLGFDFSGLAVGEFLDSAPIFFGSVLTFSVSARLFMDRRRLLWLNGDFFASTNYLLAPTFHV